MKMKHFQRLMAFVLVLCMVIPMLPEFTLPAIAAGTSTTATEKPVIVVAGSDFQNESGDETDVSLVNGLFSSIKTNGGYTTADGFLFAGDYSYQFTDAESRAGMTNLKAAVQTAYPSITDIVMVQGNHDQDAAVTDGTLSPSGDNDTDDYGVFVIHEKDYMWYNNDATTIKNTATALDTYLDAKIASDYDKPIFVVSHLPLHYNMRTANDGDGQYANYIFDVLNAAGAKGLNIIFLFGHNHSNGWDDYLGGSAVYLAKGDSINIAQASRGEFEVETLNFTYMNAGYVAYYDQKNTGAETDLTMTVFEIRGNEVTIARYSADGKHDLKSVGVANSYKSESGYEPDTRVYASAQSVALNKVLQDDTTGVVVAGSGLTSLKVVKGNISELPAGYTAYQTYDILPAGHSYGSPASVTIPVDDTFDATKPALVIDHETHKTMVCEIVDGCVHFKTNHFSMYTVAQADVETVTASGKLESHWLQATQLEENTPYVITSYLSGYVLTGTSATKTGTAANHTGLQLVNESYTTSTHKWYYDTNGLIYGDPSSTSAYLMISFNFVDSAYYGNVYLGDGNSSSRKPFIEACTSNSFTIRRTGTPYLYLNQHGGATSTIATAYQGLDDGSRWVFNTYVEDQEVALSVTPSQNAATIGSTVVLTPTVLAGGVSTSNYSVTWSSCDESIATVDENGVVTTVKPGQVYIRATLNSANGADLTSSVFVDVLLTVVEVTKNDSSVTAATHFGNQVGAQETPVAGNVYVIKFLYNGSSYVSDHVIKPGDEGYNGYKSITGLEALDDMPLYDSLWYYDGTYVYNGTTADTTKHMITDGTNITIGSADAGTPFEVDTTVNSFWPYLKAGSQYINRYGGTGYNVLGVYGSGSYLRFIKVLAPDQVVSLTVSPNEYILMPNQSVSLAPTVKVDGTKTNTYSLTWTSSDTSLATVNNGVVTSTNSNGGNVTITATLTAINGVTLNAPLAVEIPIQIPAVTKDTDAGNITASIILGERMERVTELQQGIPYVITSKLSGKLLTGNMATYTFNSAIQGLELVSNNDFSQVWYYNGTNLLYGDPNGNYLSIDSSQNTALGDGMNAVNSVTLNTDQLSFTISNTNLTGNQYLNHYGGSKGNIVRGYSTSGNDQDGSAWHFNQVVSNEKLELKIDYNPKQSIDQIQKIDATVWLDGVLKNGDYEIVWASSNTNVATVSHGIVTPKTTGKVTITARLVSVAGVDLANSFTVEIPIEVTTIKSVQISGRNGVTYVGTSSAASINQYLIVTYADGSTSRIPVKINMLADTNDKVSTETAGVRSNLTVTYAGQVVCTDFTLEVLERNADDYPDYPDEGAVRVSKTGGGIDFQASGLAQIELSATGIPSKKGADVIIMLDTSSSMTSKIGGSDQSRLQVLTASLNNLVNQLQDDGSGDATDIRVAIADFNGYYLNSTSNYYIDPNDTTVDNTVRDTSEGDDVYTGTQDLTAGAFVDVHDLGVDPFYTKGYTGTSMAKYTLTYSSGTNYDYAFDAIYQLGEAIQTKNEADHVDRDLFVIFMSDGAPFQYNYFSSQSNESGSVYWNNWLLGTFDEETMYGANANKTYYNKDGLHWMAEAIKGDPSTDYKVIRKNDSRDTDGDNWIEVKGLGAMMYSIGFCLADDHNIKIETMDTVIQNIASNSNYYYKADTASELENAFSLITNEIFYAATDAYFVDTMGAYYDIQLGTHNYEVVVGTAKETRTITPAIQFKSYSIYTRQDFMNGLCAETQIGTRKTDSNGNYIYTLMEEITFNEAGTEAYSNGGTTNILTDGVICASTFWYNTTSTAKTITLDDGTEYSLPAETFYWKLGTISTTELALSYYVYLTDSMANPGREAGIYDTNEHAELFYTNYRNNDCSQAVPTPKLPWEQATVGYGFYLVDANGNPIVSQTTGATGSFADAVKLTDPVYKYFLLNTDGTGFEAGHLVTAGDFLLDGYELFDDGAAYKVQMGSNGAGYYTIYMDADVGMKTTYVEGVGPAAVTGGHADGETVNTTGYATASTTVWFAVKAITEAVPDTVVIDYGLAVDIHPLVNDLLMTTGNAKLYGIGIYNEGTFNNYTSDAPSFETTGWLTIEDYGKARITADGASNINNAVVQFVPGTMQMDREVVFTYAVHYTGTAGAQGYYYSTITVIPATTIYYEDNFNGVDGNNYINFSTYTQVGDAQANKLTSHTWVPVNDTDASSHSNSQAEDRPGDYKISFGNIDANNIYGYDGAYTAMEMYSNASAYKFTAKKVTSGNVTTYTYGTAEFTFKGTGFDVISLTNADTGTIVIEVNDLNKAENATDKITYYIVDTYYGYQHVNGSWVVNPDATDTLYQVPVMKVEGLDYSQYKVTITVTYADFFDHDQNGNNGSYDFYLDAIRIYDPAGNVPESTVVQGTYTQDTEGWPSYEELRNKVIDKKTFDTSSDANLINGLVFIDGKASVGDAAIADYTNYGPNNELYLAKGQAVAFTLTADTSVASVHMAMKSARTTATPVKIGYYSSGKIVWTMEKNIETATDLYYDLTALKGKTVVIQNADNAGDSILSITNIKTTYTSQPGAQNQSVLSLRKSAIQDLVAALNASEDLEQLPATGDMGMSFVMMVLTASMFMLAVLVLPNTRKRNAK